MSMYGITYWRLFYERNDNDKSELNLFYEKQRDIDNKPDLLLLNCIIHCNMKVILVVLLVEPMGFNVIYRYENAYSIIGQPNAYKNVYFIVLNEFLVYIILSSLSDFLSAWDFGKKISWCKDSCDIILFGKVNRIPFWRMLSEDSSTLACAPLFWCVCVCVSYEGVSLMACSSSCNT